MALLKDLPIELWTAIAAAFVFWTKFLQSYFQNKNKDAQIKILQQDKKDLLDAFKNK